MSLPFLVLPSMLIAFASFAPAQVDSRDNPDLQANLARPGCTPAVGAESYNVVCFGADPTGARDSSPAINQAIVSSHGVRVRIPAGHYLLKSAILLGDNQVPPRLEGDGPGVTVLAPCFRGTQPPPAPGGVITMDGTKVNGASQPYHFANGGFIRNLSIDGNDANARDARGGCPQRVEGVYGPVEDNLHGIQITGWTLGEIDNVEVRFMQLDGVNFPWRSDLWDACAKVSNGQGPDCFNVTNFELKHSQIMYNGGWGFRAETALGFAYSGVTENRFHSNAGGGIYIYGWQDWVINNDVSFNGCYGILKPPRGECTKTQPVGTLSPQPGGGILMVRAGPEPASPKTIYSALLARIERNEMDSNFAYDIWIQSGDEIEVVSNRFINHRTSWQTGVGGNYPHCQVVLGYGGSGSGYIVRNPLFRDNLTRSDPSNRGSDGNQADTFETQMYCVEPGRVIQAIEQQDGTFGPNTYNFTVLASGGGAAAVCTQSGGRLGSCNMQNGGWYPPGQAPNVRVAGTGCEGQAVKAVMTASGPNGWGWVSGLEVEKPGDGCTGEVWPIFESTPFPRTNRQGNSFVGFNPVSFNNSTGAINYGFTQPESH